MAENSEAETLLTVLLTPYMSLGTFLIFSGESQMEDYDHADIDGDWERPDNTESGYCAESIYNGNMWTLGKHPNPIPQTSLLTLPVRVFIIRGAYCIVLFCKLPNISIKVPYKHNLEQFRT